MSMPCWRDSTTPSRACYQGPGRPFPQPAKLYSYKLDCGFYGYISRIPSVKVCPVAHGRPGGPSGPAQNGTRVAIGRPTALPVSHSDVASHVAHRFFFACFLPGPPQACPCAATTPPRLPPLRARYPSIFINIFRDMPAAHDGRPSSDCRRATVVADREFRQDRQKRVPGKDATTANRHPTGPA